MANRVMIGVFGLWLDQEDGKNAIGTSRFIVISRDAPAGGSSPIGNVFASLVFG